MKTTTQKRKKITNTVYTTASWKDIAGIIIDRVPKQLVENGIQATSFEIGSALKNIRRVCRNWREAVDESILWSVAVYDHSSFNRENKPLVISTLKYRQMQLFQYAMDHLSKNVPLTMDVFDLLSSILESTKYWFSRKPKLRFLVKNVSSKFECIKNLWKHETLISTLSDKTIDRTSKSFHNFVRNLTDGECTKWALEHFELEKNDFLNAIPESGIRKGVFGHYQLTVNAAKILQMTFGFSIYEALGPELEALSYHGEGGKTNLVKWIVDTFHISKPLFRSAGHLFDFETIKLAAGCGEEETCTFLADHFEMTREELVEHLIDSCAQSGYEMLEWLDNRIQLTKKEVLESNGTVCSTLKACALDDDDNNGSLRFFEEKLDMYDEIKKIKNKLKSKDEEDEEKKKDTFEKIDGAFFRLEMLKMMRQMESGVRGADGKLVHG